MPYAILRTAGAVSGRTTGRVFFEIVQRIGGYQGYGAVNAPIRLAAQHARTHTAPG